LPSSAPRLNPPPPSLEHPPPPRRSRARFLLHRRRRAQSEVDLRWRRRRDPPARAARSRRGYAPATAGRAPVAAGARDPLPEPPSASTMPKLHPSPPPSPFVTACCTGRAAGMPNPAISGAGEGRNVTLRRSLGSPPPSATHGPATSSGSSAPQPDLGLSCRARSGERGGRGRENERWGWERCCGGGE
jgi:hypothetical protein